MNNAKVIEILRNASNGIFGDESFDRTLGICSLLSVYCDRQDLRSYFNYVVQHWEKFSGNSQYPVPSPYPNLTPSEAYMDMDDIWGDEEYGALRRELAGWFADKMESDKTLPDEFGN